MWRILAVSQSLPKITIGIVCKKGGITSTASTHLQVGLLEGMALVVIALPALLGITQNTLQLPEEATRGQWVKSVLPSPVLVRTVGFAGLDPPVWLLAHAFGLPVTNDVHVIFVPLGIHPDSSGNVQLPTITPLPALNAPVRIRVVHREAFRSIEDRDFQ